MASSAGWGPGSLSDTTVTIFLLSYNRLTWLRDMVQYCELLPGADVHIVDNCSTYPPLLDWLGRCGVVVHRMEGNLGKRAVWEAGLDKTAGLRYVVSDPDLDLVGVPSDVLGVLAEGLEQYPQMRSAGLSLEVNDLPEGAITDPRRVRAWEARWWRRRRGRWWVAGIDTTFAMYRRGDQPSYGSRPSLRADRPYTARHLPWYLTPEEVTEEDRYYYSTGSTWGPRAWGPEISRKV